jgi:hypothetical protein
VKKYISWKKFEQDCLKYLNETYGNERVRFSGLGESDSNTTDIAVKINNGYSFNIEVKSSSAQSGQFVLLPNLETSNFDYSPRNKYPINDESQAMISYMNNQFDRFHNAGTSGEVLNIDESICFDWIIKYYKSKNVRFIVTGDDGQKIIFPIERFAEYFDVKAVFRVKKSGSSDPTDKNFNEIAQLVNQNISTIFKNNGKVFINSNLDLNNEKIKGSIYKYQFKSSGYNVYEVKRLSNTNNANVIFSVELKRRQASSDLESFIRSIS